MLAQKAKSVACSDTKWNSICICSKVRDVSWMGKDVGSWWREVWPHVGVRKGWLHILSVVLLLMTVVVCWPAVVWLLEAWWRIGEIWHGELMVVVMLGL